MEPGEDPSKVLLRDCTTSPINRFAALVTTVPDGLQSPAPSVPRPHPRVCVTLPSPAPPPTV